jgi:hypothetical protein
MAIKGSKRAHDHNRIARRHAMLEPVGYRAASCGNCVAAACLGKGTVLCNDWTRSTYQGGK